MEKITIAFCPNPSEKWNKNLSCCNKLTATLPTEPTNELVSVLCLEMK